MSREEDLRLMRLAIEQAQRGGEQGEVPVGAVLVLEDGREFAAHNAPIDQNDASAHAEMRAIRAACKAISNYRLTGSTLHVTLEPCLMCAGAIVHARIARVVYGANDPKAGAVQSLYQVLNDERLNHQPDVASSMMNEECGALLKSFFKDLRKS
ncbi:MAG: tRNA adenosine(34) deaminase TadA [Mariprofundaceae bacterium]